MNVKNNFYSKTRYCKSNLSINQLINPKVKVNFKGNKIKYGTYE